MGHRIAHELGLRNVTPYAFMNAIVTRSQMQTLIDTVRQDDVRAIYVPTPGGRLLQEADIAPQQLQLLIDAGFRRTSSLDLMPEGGIIELTRDEAAR